MSKGGIIIPETAADGRQFLVQIGTIVDVGPDAWKAFRQIDDNGKMVNGRPWARKGDKVTFAKNAGMWIVDENGEKTGLLAMLDDDIILVWQEEDVVNE